MSVVDERESLTTLLDDLAKLQKVAETLSPDDERSGIWQPSSATG